MRQRFQQRKRNILNEQQVHDIFLLKKSIGNEVGRSGRVSKMYNISPKAVRDIWNLRTWRHITHDLIDCTIHPKNCVADERLTLLHTSKDKGTNQNPVSGLTLVDALSEVSNDPSPRPRIGRPSGSKDKHPRRKRCMLGHQEVLPPAVMCERERKTPTFLVSAALESDSMQTLSISSSHLPWDPPVQQAGEEEKELSRAYPFFLDIEERPNLPTGPDSRSPSPFARWPAERGEG